jgi:rhodanese-related sulfurtransferase
MSSVARRARQMLVRDILAAAAVILVSVPIGLGLNLLHAEPVPLGPVPTDVLLARSVGRTLTPGGNVRDITLDDVVTAQADGRTVILDAREEPIFALGHLPGARNLPRADFASTFTALAIDANRPVILYCSDPGCPDSTVVARALTHLGFRDVAVFSGGWDEWQAAGLPREP